MSMEWLKRITESKENRQARELEELTKSNKFQEIIAQKAAEVVEENRLKEVKAKEEIAKKHKEKVEKAKSDLEMLGENMKDSNEPFVNILSMGFNKENGIEVRLDYNAAFIKYLHAAGIKAPNDEETIRLWLAHLNYDISEETKARDYLMNGVSEDEKPSMSYDEMFETDKSDED